MDGLTLLSSEIGEKRTPLPRAAALCARETRGAGGRFWEEFCRLLDKEPGEDLAMLYRKALFQGDWGLEGGDLRELAALRRLSQRMLERINRNYRSILTINTSLLALGIFGILPPTTTALLHNASTMAISAASMRPYLPAPGGRGAQGKEPGNETA